MSRQRGEQRPPGLEPPSRQPRGQVPAVPSSSGPGSHHPVHWRSRGGRGAPHAGAHHELRTRNAEPDSSRASNRSRGVGGIGPPGGAPSQDEETAHKVGREEGGEETTKTRGSRRREAEREQEEEAEKGKERTEKDSRRGRKSNRGTNRRRWEARATTLCLEEEEGEDEEGEEKAQEEEKKRKSNERPNELVAIL